MFDVIQISWWFLQVTLVGYLCNYRAFTNDTDRLLFAPISGLAALLIVANTLWMWNFPTYLTSFLLAASLGAAVLFIWRKHPGLGGWDRGTLPVLAWMFGGMLLIAMHGSLIPFDQKVFQGFPIDRIGYVASYVLFQQEPLDYFTQALARLTFNGDKHVLFIHPMVGAALNEMQARTAAGLGFISVAWLTPRDLHQLGNAWEVFLRTIQFVSVFSLFSKVLHGRPIAGFLTLGTVFGYWFQYMKDFNSWPHMVTLALIIAIIALLISFLNAKSMTDAGRRLVYVFAFTMVINHPEFGLVLGLGISIVILSNDFLRTSFLMRKSIIFEAVIFIAMVFLVHPYILSWLHRVFAGSPSYMGFEQYLARGIYSLFGTDAELETFVGTIYSQPFRLFSPVALGNIAIGTLGFPYIAAAGSAVALGGTSLILAVLPRRRRTQIVLGLMGLGLVFVASIWPLTFKSAFVDSFTSIVLGGMLVALLIYAMVTTRAPNVRVLIILVAFHFVFFAASLIAYRYLGILGAGSAYRSITYWSIFASMALTLLLATSSVPTLRLLAVVFAFLNLLFGLSIFWVTNQSGMESYASFYPNRDGVVHFQKAGVRKHYSFDYLDLVEPLRRCNSVFLDFKDIQERGEGRFQAANLLVFLDNNHIPSRLGFPYLGGYQIVGPPYSYGFKKEDANPDCIVDQEMREGRWSYRLSVVPWK